MRHRRARLVVAAALLASTGCGGSLSWDCPAPPPPVDVGTFPYHPLVYNLDLAILAYQVHGQSLVWPFDPYYEERADLFSTQREDFMSDVHDWAEFTQGPAQASTRDAPDATRGPGALVGYPSNRDHDPILYDYSRVHPWASCVMNAANQWTEYLTPRAITAKILEASVAYRYLPPTGPEQILIAKLPTSRPADRDPDAADLLFAFEGGTGDRGIVGQPASQSLLGIVLARSTGPMSYDLHIAFRGSRSGKATRAFFEALSTNDPAGNPDWITDLGVTHIPAPAISTVGEVAEGFATSVQYTLPVIVECLKAIATAKGRAPRNIYVTGHSLGGALAQHFASAVLLGADYGPDGVGPSMPTALRFWPWKRLKLITFGAPRAGDEDWARALTIQKLQSEFYGAALPYDPDALSPTNPAVAPRLLDPTNPVAYRVLISTDPITTSLAGGKPVGETVYVNKDCAPIVGLPNPNAHEPALIRDGILAATGDSRTPTVAWRYLDMTDLNPARDDAHAGGPVEFEKLRDAVRRYYFDRNLWFDDAGFCDDFNTMRAIEGLPPAVCPPL